MTVSCVRRKEGLYIIIIIEILTMKISGVIKEKFIASNRCML